MALCIPSSQSLAVVVQSSLSSSSLLASPYHPSLSLDPSSSLSVTCSTSAPTRTSTSVQKAPFLCPSRPAPSQGDWNSRMLFNRGLDTIKDVDKDNFWTTVEAAGDKLVVVDLYSRWCGPCRMIYPKIVKLSDEYEDVVFLKLDCSNDNKFLFSKMGVGILPTFKIFKNSSLVSEVKGAKFEELVRKIEKARVIMEDEVLVV